MIVVLRDAETFVLAHAVRGTVEELCTWDKSGGLCQPGGIPERSNFASCLIARSGAAIEAVEGWRAEEQSVAHQCGNLEKAVTVVHGNPSFLLSNVREWV